MRERAENRPSTAPLNLGVLFSARRWAPVPRQSLFLLSALPLAITVPVVTIVLVSVGAGLAILGVGIVVLLLAAAVSRGFGNLELRRLAWTGAAPIEPPAWPDLRGSGWITRAQAVLLDRKQWSYIVHCGLYLVLGTISGSLTLAWLSSIVNGATRWLWNGWVTTTPQELAEAGIDVAVLRFLLPLLQGPVGVIAYTLLGALALVTLPWFTQGMVDLHDRIARVFLGRFTPAEVEAQMAGLRRSRQAGVAAEGRTLRKLERDLHDGPQQQLLRLQLDLAAARRQLESDPEAAARLIEEAGRRSADTLTELRHLVRGIAPPILQDRGLAAALAALAERNSIPTSVKVDIDPALTVEPAVQQGVYFVVAELLANTAKHSGANRVSVECRGSLSERQLTITVVDDGKGQAIMVPGHGLAGIAERVVGLGGDLSLDSPEGGPTRVTVAVPA